MAELALIVAISEDGCIGNENKLIFKDKQDMAFFKAMTLGKSLIMGRKTFESIGKPLPNRKNIVVSSTLESCTKETLGTIVVKDIMEAFDHIKDDEDVMFIGGGEVYKEAIKFCKTLYISRFKKRSESCDVWFPLEGISEYTLTTTQEYDNFNLEVYVRL